MQWGMSRILKIEAHKEAHTRFCKIMAVHKILYGSEVPTHKPYLPWKWSSVLHSCSKLNKALNNGIYKLKEL